jgi:hypothetical protein
MELKHCLVHNSLTHVSRQAEQRFAEFHNRCYLNRQRWTTGQVKMKSGTDYAAAYRVCKHIEHSSADIGNQLKKKNNIIHNKSTFKYMQ